MAWALRDPRGALPLAAAVSYAAVSHAAGVVLILRSAASWRRGGAEAGVAGAAALGVVLAAHGRVIATYLVHDAAHSSVFKRLQSNEWLGILCLWLCEALPLMRPCDSPPVIHVLHEPLC